MVFTYWRKSPEAENVRSCIELEKAGGPRISCTYVQDQIRKTYECGSDAMVVATLGSTGQTRVLNGEDLRMLAELVLERFRAEAGIPQMPKLQTELPGYGQETEVEEQEQEEGNTCMQVMMDKAMVVATGMEMMKAHQQLLADTCAANVKAIEAYMAAATENLVKTGSVGELKAVEIKVPECKVKAYEDCLRKVRHMAGSEVPSTSEVMFLLAEARDVTPIAVKKLTVTLA